MKGLVSTIDDRPQSLYHHTQCMAENFYYSIRQSLALFHPHYNIDR
jgi:hypothetical protein